MTPIAAASRGKRYKLRIARVGCETWFCCKTTGFRAVTRLRTLALNWLWLTTVLLAGVYFHHDRRSKLAQTSA